MHEILCLDDQRRILVDRAALKAVHVELGAAATAHLWAVTGKSSELQILPPESELARLRDKYDEPDAGDDLLWDSPDDKDAGLHHTLAGFFRITCVTHGKKIRVTFPADVVDIGLLRTEESVAVYWRGEKLQIWRRDRWEERIRVPRMHELTRSVREMIEK